MANDIKRKKLYQKLGSIKRGEEWIAAADRLGLRVVRGSKHPSTIRDPKLPDDVGKASLITVIPSHLHKRINEMIFKQILNFGIQEDDIWVALGFL